MTIRIFVVDSHLVYRRGLISILGEYPEFQVVGEAADSQEAVAKMGEIQSDIVIMDVFIDGGEGVEAINYLQQRFPCVKVLILTVSDREEDFFEAIKAGARGFLLKSVMPNELIESIRLVAGGNVIVSPSKAFRMLKELGEANNQCKNGSNHLSPREKEVLQLVAQGASNKEIAAHCYVSETTVKAHLGRILEKLDVKNRAQAAALATTRGLLDQP